MKSKNTGYLFLLNTIVLFSTYEVVSKTMAGKVNPFQINFLRFFIGGVLLLVFLLAKRDFKIKKADIPGVLLLGIINVGLSMNLMQISLNMNNSKASIVAVIFSSNPIFVAVFSGIMEKEKIGIHKIIGLVMGLAGVVIISFNNMNFSDINMMSPLLALISAILYGLYTVLGRRVSSRTGSMKMNSYSFIWGSLIVLPFILFFKVPVFNVGASSIIPLLYLSLFVSGIAYVTYFMGLTRVGASSGSMVFFLKPVLASIFAFVFLREQLSYNLIAGTVIILLSIYFSIKKNRKPVIDTNR